MGAFKERVIEQMDIYHCDGNCLKCNSVEHCDCEIKKELEEQSYQNMISNLTSCCRSGRCD